MKVKIIPSKANGKVVAPPSKSMAHRMLIGAGLAEGTSVISNIDLSEDIKATLGILSAMGCDYQYRDRKIMITGIGKKEIVPATELDCKESGSTLRFFVPILMACSEKEVFVGAKRLFERPLDIYESICQEQGILFQKNTENLLVQGKLSAGSYRVSGGISSQFITGLLFALPLLEGDSTLEILPPVESKAYINMTLETLEWYGIRIIQKGFQYHIKGNQSYVSRDGEIEGDYSNAAFLDAYNLIGGNVEVTGLRKDSLQGDQVYRRYFEELQKGYAVLDISDCPDLGPILMGMAAANNGAKLTGTKRLKIKESDRGAAMAQELAKMNIEVCVEENELEVKKGLLQPPIKELDSHNDHRIAMTLSTLCTITGGIIDRAESVRKSYPNYFEIIKTLGIRQEELS